MQLVILAAGHGRRFGGLKQLAPVGPDGQAIMDYTALAAHSCGYDGILVIVRDDIRDEIAAHIKHHWPSDIEVDLLCQGPVAGTAQAVLSAKPAVRGAFGVANADDLYGEPALRALRAHFERTPGTPWTPNDVRQHHLLVAYHLVKTVLTSAPLVRGLCDVDESDNLRAIVENTVCLRSDGRFDAEPLSPTRRAEHRGPVVLDGSEWVSMNLWGFHPRMLGHLEGALRSYHSTGSRRAELLLPDVVGELVTSGRDAVHVIETDERCVGITHTEDMTFVRDELGFSAAARPALRGNRPV